MNREQAKHLALRAINDRYYSLEHEHVELCDPRLAAWLGVQHMETPVACISSIHTMMPARTYMTKAVIPLGWHSVSCKDVIAVLKPCFPPDVAYLHSVVLQRNLWHWVVYIRVVKAHQIRRPE